MVINGIVSSLKLSNSPIGKLGDFWGIGEFRFVECGHRGGWDTPIENSPLFDTSILIKLNHIF